MSTAQALGNLDAPYRDVEFVPPFDGLFLQVWKLSDIHSCVTCYWSWGFLFSFSVTPEEFLNLPLLFNQDAGESVSAPWNASGSGNITLYIATSCKFFLLYKTHRLRLSKESQWTDAEVRIETLTRDVLGSNLCRGAEYRGCLQCLQYVWTISQLCHNPFLPNPLMFISNQSLYNRTLDEAKTKL